MPTAELTLRFGATRLPTTVRWPLPGADSLVLALADEVSPADPLLARCTVLAVSRRDEPGVELAALRWLGDHASELGDPRHRLLVAGGARAAWLALAARDDGWPILDHQVLLHPRFTAEHPMPTALAGLAPASVVSGHDGARYAAALRRAGVAVREIRR